MTCRHRFCKHQKISNPWGQGVHTFSCQESPNSPGVYDCLTDNLERFKKIHKQDKTRALTIWETLEVIPEQLFLKAPYFQVFISHHDHLNNVKRYLEKYEGKLYLLCDPEVFSPNETLQIRDEIEALGISLEDQSTFTGVYYDFTLGKYDDRNPDVEIKCLSTVENPKSSVIIPHFNHHQEILHTLNALSQTKEIEIIVVDDGSTPPLTPEYLKDYNLTLLRLSRPELREMGQNNYRAGVARNIGFCYSRGENIFFLDADILTPKSIISEAERLLKEQDIIQFSRHHLKESIAIAPFDKLIANKKNFYSRSNGYFESFQEDKTLWKEIPYGWKYFSTFAIALRREVFEKCGSFSPSFCLYGFEDVELGFRSWKENFKFHKSHIPVIAQFHEKGRSEYQNDKSKKMIMLQKTSRLFFIQNPLREVFEGLKGVL